MGRITILIEQGEGLVKSQIKQEAVTVNDWSLVIGELELIKLQALAFIQSKRKSETR